MFQLSFQYQSGFWISSLQQNHMGCECPWMTCCQVQMHDGTLIGVSTFPCQTINRLPAEFCISSLHLRGALWVGEENQALACSDGSSAKSPGGRSRTPFHNNTQLWGENWAGLNWENIIFLPFLDHFFTEVEFSFFYLPSVRLYWY